MSRGARFARVVAFTTLWFVAGVWVAAYVVERVYGVPLLHGAFRFQRPWLAVLLVAPLAVLMVRAGFARHAAPRLRVSLERTLGALPSGRRVWMRDAALAGRVAALALLVVALMGPQSVHARAREDVQGIDIVIALDMSLSMRERDIRPDRFDAAKAVVDAFIERRPNDRIGAVIFGRDAYTLMPLTTDARALRETIANLNLRLIDGRGTAIGNALGVSLNRLRGSDAKSKVIILVTDGESNTGNISPEEGAQLASEMGVKVYTVLMGTTAGGVAAQTGLDAIFGQPSGGDSNPELLQRIATRTGGAYFAVSDRAGLEHSFHSILNALDKSEIEDAGRVYGELYPAFAWPAFFLLAGEWLLGTLALRRWP